MSEGFVEWGERHRVGHSTTIDGCEQPAKEQSVWFKNGQQGLACIDLYLGVYLNHESAMLLKEKRLRQG